MHARPCKREHSRERCCTQNSLLLFLRDLPDSPSPPSSLAVARRADDCCEAGKEGAGQPVMAAALAEIERALKALPVEQLKLLLHDEAEFDRCITFLLTLALLARCGEHDASVPVARCSHDGALRSYFEKHTPMLSEKQQLVAQIKQANIDLAHHNIRDEIAVTSTQTQKDRQTDRQTD